MSRGIGSIHNKTIFDGTYEGFESLADIDRDISEMWDTSSVGIPGEFQGKVRVQVWYEPTIEERETF